MSKLKTMRTLQSIKNVSIHGNRRRSSLISNTNNHRNSHKLSIMPIFGTKNIQKPENLLKKLGQSCSFFYSYLG